MVVNFCEVNSHGMYWINLTLMTIKILVGQFTSTSQVVHDMHWNDYHSVTFSSKLAITRGCGIPEGSVHLQGSKNNNDPNNTITLVTDLLCECF